MSILKLSHKSTHLLLETSEDALTFELESFGLNQTVPEKLAKATWSDYPKLTVQTTMKPDAQGQERVIFSNNSIREMALLSNTSMPVMPAKLR